MLWGSGVSLSAVVLVSVFSNEPFKRAALQDAVDTTQVALSETTQKPPAAAPTPEEVAPVATLPAPQPDTLAGLSETVQESAAVPQTGTAPDLNQPLAGLAVQNGMSAPQADAPVAGQTQQPKLSAPDTDSADTVSTTPAAPPASATPLQDDAPQVQTEIAAMQPPTLAETGVAPSPAPGVGSISTDPAQPQAPDLTAQTSAFLEPSGVAQSASVDPAQPVMPVVEETATDALKTPAVMAQTSTPAPAETIDLSAPDASDILGAAAENAQLDTQNSSVPVAQVQVQVTQTPLPLASATPTEPKPESSPVVQAEIAKPAASQPDAAADSPPIPPAPVPQVSPIVRDTASRDSALPTIGDLADEVTTNRLPSVGTEPDAPVILPVPEAYVKTPEIVAMKPIQEFAQPVDNPENKPVMAIVLMDYGVDLGGDGIGLPALRSFPYPLTFAVDFSLPDAAERSDAYRAEGFEVMAMVDLPEGADARDAETNLAVALQAVPEAVGVLEGTRTGVQSSRDAAQQVASILASSGHGFVTQNRGLNTVQKLAARTGVPSAVVFRDFDSENQTPTVIRRFLDQAAFRADQEGGVVMLGRLREDTISALIIWGLQDRASKVALVPVTGALKTQ